MPYRIVIAAVTLVGALSACSQSPTGAAIHDPYEATNRKVHDFNVALDSALLRPAGQVANAVPSEITGRVTNFASNLSLPGKIVNGVLQANVEGVATNTLRLVLNTTIGFGGLFDPAGAIGLYEQDTDFGETLAVWGVGEGAYVELPGFGPSTERDAVGTMVDLFFNPLSGVLTPQELRYSNGAKVADRIIMRGNYGSTVDSVLYESADSYAQTRLLYLQNRRYQLGTTLETDYMDPYADDPYADPYFDPYEDQ